MVKAINIERYNRSRDSRVRKGRRIVSEVCVLRVRLLRLDRVLQSTYGSAVRRVRRRVVGLRQ